MTLKQTKEVLSAKSGETMIKVSDLAQHGINVSKEFISKHGEKLIKETEIGKLRAKSTAEEQTNALKGLLGLKSEVVKGATDKIEQVSQKIKEATSKGNLEQIGSGNEAERELKESLEKTDGVKTEQTIKEKLQNSGIKDNLKKGVEKAKEGAKEVSENSWIIKIINWFKDIFKTVLGWFGLDKFFGLDKINPEKINETKEKTKNFINEKFGKTLKPEEMKKINETIENLSEDEVKKLYEKIEKGELKWEDITSIIPNIGQSINKEEIKKKTEGLIINALKKEIQEKYKINLNDPKNKKRLNDLEVLVKNNLKISDDTIEKFIEINEKKEIKGSDLFGPGFEFVLNSTVLLFGLITKGIVPISAFGLNFVESSTDVIKLSADAIGISKVIDIDTFNKSLENLSKEEKNIMLGLLYRKGGLFLDLIGSIGATISRIGIGFVTKTSVDGTDLLKASISKDYTKQIENFDKIAKTLGNHKDSKNILNEAITNLNKIKQNSNILKILEQSKGNTTKAIELLTEAKIKIPNDRITDFPEFVKSFKNLINPKITDKLSSGSFFSKFGFGAQADLYKFNKNLEMISYNQRQMFDGNFLQKGLGKVRELINIGKTSRLGDRLVLHFESIGEASKNLSKFQIVANQFPDLVKGFFGKLPIIAVAGLSLKSEEPIKEFRNQIKYLFPIVGPCLLLSESGFNWENGFKSINGIEAGIGFSLLTLDGVFLAKAFAGDGFSGGLKYMTKPITDIYSMGKGIGKGGYSVGKALTNGKSVNLAFKEALAESKFIKGTKGKLKAVAILAVLGYAGYKIAFSDNHLKEIFGEDGKMDKEKLKKEIGKLNNEEKETCLKYLIGETFGENYLNNLEIKIKNNNLEIVSKNNIVQGDWIVDNGMLNILQLNPDFSFKYTPQKTA